MTREAIQSAIESFRCLHHKGTNLHLCKVLQIRCAAFLGGQSSRKSSCQPCLASVMKWELLYPLWQVIRLYIEWKIIIETVNIVTCYCVHGQQIHTAFLILPCFLLLCLSYHSVLQSPIAAKKVLSKDTIILNSGPVYMRENISLARLFIREFPPHLSALELKGEMKESLASTKCEGINQ